MRDTFGWLLFRVVGNSLKCPITQKGTNVPMMRTRAKQKHVTSDRARRENVPRHILFHYRRELIRLKITYIHHSSFSVELENAVILFDYFKGTLPEFPAGKPLFIFASHFHADHYAPVIFQLGEKRENVFYILSKEIGKKIPEEYRKRYKDRMRLVKAGERFCLNISEESLIVETFHSTDEGVAFWLSCEGKEIYHAGDLNNWWWEGEDMAWNRNMAASYKQEMKKLSGRTADLAFIPVDPRLGQWFYLGAAGFMEQADTKWIFPMHFWEDYTIIPKLIEHSSSEGWRDRIVEIHKEGEEFIR